MTGESIALENFLIRVVTESDLPALLRIEGECYPLPWTQQQFVAELNNKVATLLVCEINQQIAGYICYWLIGAEMEILNLATAPSARRKGVAGKLMTEAFSRYSVDKLSAAWLEVRAKNQAAIALYQQSGFVPSGIRKGYYRNGEDAIVMMKTFNNR